MNLKPDVFSLPSSESPFLTNLAETEIPLSQHVSKEQDLTCYLTKKRKWDDGANSTVIADGETEEAHCSLGEKSTDDCFMWKKPATFQCSENSQFSKRLKTMSRKEKNVLRIQIAMISDDDGDRPIHVAVAQENLQLVRKLCTLMLKAAISLDLTNYLRQTPLHLSVMLGNVDMIHLLLKCGASVSLKDRNGNSIIHLAVKTSAKKGVLEILLSHPDTKSLLNSLDHEGYSALHYAALQSNETAVRCLHSFGAWMNVIDGKSGRTPIIHAILEHNAKMVSLLLECGASVEIVDYSGRTAFELALQSSNKQIVKLLEKVLFSEASVGGTSQGDSYLSNTGTVSNYACNKRTRSEKISSSVKTRSSSKKTEFSDKT